MEELKENLIFIREMELYKCKSATGSPLLNSMTIYKGSHIESQIPNDAWLGKSQLSGVRAYRIIDKKANAVRELIRWYRGKIHERLNNHQPSTINNR